MAYTAEQTDYFEREARKAATELQDLNLRGPQRVPIRERHQGAQSPAA
jgi:hypothetical protein